jgi:diguanylate cyclase (GGDEF)-like protein
MRIAHRVSLAVGILLFLLFVTNAVSFLLTTRVQEVTVNLAQVDDAREAAALDMELRLAGTARRITAFVLVPDPGALDAARESIAGLDEAVAAYMEVAATEEEAALAGELAASFDAFKGLAEEVVALVDRETREGTGPELTRQKGSLLADFEAQRQRIDELLSESIVPLIRAAKARSQNNVVVATDIVIVYILIMTGFGIVVGIGTAIALIRGIVRPILEMKASADAVGKGVLEHRISVTSDDEIGQLATSFNRMAENRQQSEEALRELAHQDPLTRLPNRNFFHRRLVEAMDNAKRVNRMVALYFLDLDNFKDVNDTLGHPSGDALLKHVAQRLKGCARTSDTVARLGGDEFAVIQTNLTDYNGIAVLARRVIDNLSEPFDLDGESVYSGTSVGITVYPGDGATPEQIVKNADLALYRAKSEGGNNYLLYDPEMNADIQARRLLERDLRLAVDRNEFFLNYQPQIELASGQIVGAEALLRWRHPERGMVSPGEFIPVAEQTGLIVQLTERVLRTACRQTKAWHEAGLPTIRVSVNLSPADLRRPDLIPTVKTILEDTGVDPERVELEITEGMVMADVDAVIVVLQELHALGVEIAIDDFGTGYSSMAYLKQFPVDRLKIDQAFVRDILENKEDAGITRAIIALGHSLGLKVIAEGVETAEILAYLHAEQCDEIQGYFISRPLVAKEFVEFVAQYIPVAASAPAGITEGTGDAAE